MPPTPLKQYCFKKKGIPLCFLSCRISASIYWARSQGIKVLLVVHCEAAGSAVRDRQRRARELCRTRRNAAALKGDEGLLPATKAGACRTGRVQCCSEGCSSKISPAAELRARRLPSERRKSSGCFHREVRTAEVSRTSGSWMRQGQKAEWDTFFGAVLAQGGDDFRKVPGTPSCERPGF